MDAVNFDDDRVIQEDLQVGNRGGPKGQVLLDGLDLFGCGLLAVDENFYQADAGKNIIILFLIMRAALLKNSLKDHAMSHIEDEIKKYGICHLIFLGMSKNRGQGGNSPLIFVSQGDLYGAALQPFRNCLTSFHSRR